ncbi:MAG: glycosyltransferase family 39 protein [Bacteroidia bacterium]|nr:glycosyltransferase family 39 protein [Bacteroidia bacterium]
MQQYFSDKESRTDFIIFLLIVITGAALRFIYFDNCPYTHDEISSLVRTGYSSFSELIEKGVKPDTHPPLLQVFLQYYTKLFGTSEMVVKFPFVICGIFSIVFVYMIASKWFSRTTGLFSAAIIASVQYTTMYSVIARQYSPGLFLTLLLVIFQIKYFESKDKIKYRWLIAFTLTGAACSYLHYFCLLFVAIVSITGFLFVNKRTFLPYLISCAAIPVLFLPYLPVFFIQLGYKGVGGKEGWLGTPDTGFFLSYLKYIFHYSRLFLFLIAGIFFFSFVRNIIQKNKTITAARMICIAWFLIPLLTGYFYSVKVNPILQFSILIFSFPYLLMFLFSFLQNISSVIKVSLVILILIVSTISLVYGRKHYELFYNQGINKVVSEINNVKQQYGKDSVYAVINIEDYFLNYYKEKYPVDTNSNYRSISDEDELRNFRNIVSESKSNYFVFATIRVYPTECIEILKEYFPYTVFSYQGHLTEIYCCSKISNASSQIDETIFSISNNFSGKINRWNYDINKVSTDSISGDKYLKYEPADEFGAEFSIPLEELIKNKNDIITTSLSANMEDTSSSPMLVMSMENDGKILDWRASKFSNYLNPNETGTVILTVRFSDVHITTKNTNLKIYVWNNNHASFGVKNFTVNSKKGNPFFYGLFEDFSE